MNTQDLHLQEKERLAELESYSILDTLPEEDYDNLTTIASEICDTPISLISLIDNKRQWFKSKHGIVAEETPREIAFCSHAIEDKSSIFEIEDAREDNRFKFNPLVLEDPKVVFYAGVPLITEKGYALGTLCVIDNKPKKLTEKQVQSLKALSNQAMRLMELRKKTILLEDTLQNLKERNEELERYEFISVHDLKTPLVSISSMTQLLSQQYGSVIEDNGLEMLDSIQNSSQKLKNLISGLLEFNQQENKLNESKTWVNLSSIISEIDNIFSDSDQLSIRLNADSKEIFTNKTATNQLIINLIANTLKANERMVNAIEVTIEQDETHYRFSSRDVSTIEKLKSHQRQFQLLEKLSGKDKFGKIGNGIGLATVHKIVEKNGGKVEMQTGPKGKPLFVFTLEKAELPDLVN
ncbi:sensor histidine kinase [Arcticibacterium luteifluviistationis]|uniref:histidine kinase n=1 Tax=Arcticibacterium luteifluviistationis TaxID=1784714 RepID=A0A2Z4G7N7_9BACT|nr:GAF domain-containing protein [Arcticibacterium luteifluviistationis]AWV97182.1 histidine kinase [Arcticibacterium luteifluviistationis]